MNARRKKPIPVEELPRLEDSEEWRVAVSEEHLAAQAYERVLKAHKAADRGKGSFLPFPLLQVARPDPTPGRAHNVGRSAGDATSAPCS